MSSPFRPASVPRGCAQQAASPLSKKAGGSFQQALSDGTIPSGRAWIFAVCLHRPQRVILPSRMRSFITSTALSRHAGVGPVLTVEVSVVCIVKAVQKEQIAPFEPCGDYIK